MQKSTIKTTQAPTGLNKNGGVTKSTMPVRSSPAPSVPNPKNKTATSPVAAPATPVQRASSAGTKSTMPIRRSPAPSVPVQAQKKATVPMTQGYNAAGGAAKIGGATKPTTSPTPVPTAANRAVSTGAGVGMKSPTTATNMTNQLLSKQYENNQKIKGTGTMTSSRPAISGVKTKAR